MQLLFRTGNTRVIDAYPDETLDKDFSKASLRKVKSILYSDRAKISLQNHASITRALPFQNYYCIYLIICEH